LPAFLLLFLDSFVSTRYLASSAARVRGKTECLEGSLIDGEVKWQQERTEEAEMRCQKESNFAKNAVKALQSEKK